MKHENTKKIKEHLEFLGFNVTDESLDTEDNDVLTARHPSRYLLRVFSKENFGSLVIFLSGFSQASKKQAEFLKALNTVNYRSTFIKLSVTDKTLQDGTIMVDTYYYRYEKEQFGYILDRFYAELNDFSQELLVFTDLKK